MAFDITSWGPNSKVNESISKIIENFRVLRENNPIQAPLIQDICQSMHLGNAVKIVCYGDSITNGYTGAVQVPTPYPARLQTILRSHYNNQNITVVNQGTVGQTSSQGLTNFDTDVVAQNPTAVVIMYGINDVVVGTTIETYATNLISMVNKCFQDGITPVLMNAPPTFYPSWSEPLSQTNKNIYIFSQAVQIICHAYNIDFVDINNIFQELYVKKVYAYNSLQPDNFTHFNGLGYQIMGDMVFWKLFNLDRAVLRLDKQENVSIPICYSPFVSTNIAGSEVNSQQFYYFNTIAPSDGSLGGFLSFDFVVEVPHMDLYLVSPKKLNGGKITVNIVTPGSSKSTTIDFYSPSSIFDVKSLILKDMDIGYYYVSFNINDATTGQSTASPYAIFLSAFSFEPTKHYTLDKLYSTSGTQGVYTKMEKLIPSSLSYSGALNSYSNLILYDSPSLDLVTDLTLSIEFEGLLYNGCGVLWFGNKADNTLGASLGYLLQFGPDSITLQSNGTWIAGGSITLDYTKTNVVKILHTKAGAISIYIDDALPAQLQILCMMLVIVVYTVHLLLQQQL